MGVGCFVRGFQVQQSHLQGDADEEAGRGAARAALVSAIAVEAPSLEREKERERETERRVAAESGMSARLLREPVWEMQGRKLGASFRDLDTGTGGQAARVCEGRREEKAGFDYDGWRRENRQEGFAEAERFQELMQMKRKLFMSSSVPEAPFRPASEKEKEKEKEDLGRRSGTGRNGSPAAARQSALGRSPVGAREVAHPPDMPVSKNYRSTELRGRGVSGMDRTAARAAALPSAATAGIQRPSTWERIAQDVDSPDLSPELRVIPQPDAGRHLVLDQHQLPVASIPSSPSPTLAPAGSTARERDRDRDRNRNRDRDRERDRRSSSPKPSSSSTSLWAIYTPTQRKIHKMSSLSEPSAHRLAALGISPMWGGDGGGDEACGRGSEPRDGGVKGLMGGRGGDALRREIRMERERERREHEELQERERREDKRRAQELKKEAALAETRSHLSPSRPPSCPPSFPSCVRARVRVCVWVGARVRTLLHQHSNHHSISRRVGAYLLFSRHPTGAARLFRPPDPFYAAPISLLSTVSPAAG